MVPLLIFRVKQIDDGFVCCVGYENSKLALFDARTGEHFYQHDMGAGPITSVNVHKGAFGLVLGMADGDLLKWDLRAGKLVSRLKIHQKKDGDAIHCVEVSDQNYIATAGADGKICLLK